MIQTRSISMARGVPATNLIGTSVIVSTSIQIAPTPCWHPQF